MNPNQPLTSSLAQHPVGAQGKKLLDQLSDQLRIKHYSLRQELLGHKDVKTTMIYTHVLQRHAAGTTPAAQRGVRAVKSPLDP